MVSTGVLLLIMLVLVSLDYVFLDFATIKS